MDTYFGFEQLMASIGLGSPLARSAIGAAIFSVPIFLHAKISYDEVSENVFVPRPWSLLSKDENSTAFPWFIFPILGACIFGLFL